jgi:hypothetical protein
MLVGREKEIEKIVCNLRRNAHTLVYGTSGIGKSAILREAARRLNEAASAESRAIYIGDCGRRKILVQGMLLDLSSVECNAQAAGLPTGKSLSRLPYRDLRNMAFDRADGKVIWLLLDHLPKMNRRMEHLFEMLESKCTLAFAVTAGPYGYHRFFYKYDKVEVSALPRKAALHWIERDLAQEGYGERLRNAMAGELYHLTGGIPRSIAITLDEVRSRHPLLDDPIQLRSIYFSARWRHFRAELVKTNHDGI